MNELAHRLSRGAGGITDRPARFGAGAAARAATGRVLVRVPFTGPRGGTEPRFRPDPVRSSSSLYDRYRMGDSG